MLTHIICRARFLFLLFITALWGQAAHAALPSMPAGVYKLDPRHTSVIFKISHLGFSTFVGRFNRVEGEYTYNPEVPEHSNLDVTIYPGSIDTNDNELDEALVGDNWFNVLKFPLATFHATQIEITGDKTAKITGDFTLHNVTHTLTLDAVLVGAGTMPLLGTQVTGFSVSGHLNRSAYGISNLEPMIADDVTLEINAEFEKDK